MQNLTFEKPDIDTFKGLALAYEAGKIWWLNAMCNECS